MRPRGRVMNRKFVLPMLLVAPLAFAQDGKDEGVFEPGVQHVCVPTADGEGWDCGTAEAPPESYTPPAPEPEVPPAAATGEESVPSADTESVADAVEETPPPPPFLADPMRDTPYAPIEDTQPEPSNAAEAVIAAEQSAPAPSVAEPEAAPMAAPEPEVAPVAAEDVAPKSQPMAEAVVAAPEPAAPPEPVATVAPTRTDGPLADAAAFAQLPASAFTLQLAYAASADGFPRLVAALGLDPASCYALRVRGANGPTWLLAHGAFPDANSAKAAQAQLPRVDGLLAQWPRRIGALQTDISQGH